MRQVRTRSIGSAARLRARKVTRSRVARSIQWTSSKTRSVGRSAASRPRIASTPSSMRAVANGSSVAEPSSPSAGTRRASCGRTGPSISSSSGQGVVRANPRSASASGSSGSPPSARSRQPPTITRPPASTTAAPSSLTRRVLPIPASPAISSMRGDPAAAASYTATSRARSSSRPTNGLGCATAGPACPADRSLMHSRVRPRQAREQVGHDRSGRDQSPAVSDSSRIMSTTSGVTSGSTISK